VARLALDGLRARLGLGPPEGEAWFHLPDKDLPFAPHKNKHRAIVLRLWPESGPLAVVYARTTQKHKSEPLNPAHGHRAEWPGCWLDREGWVVTRLPMPVSKDKLCDANRLCSEDDQDTVKAVMAGPT